MLRIILFKNIFPFLTAIANFLLSDVDLRFKIEDVVNTHT